MAAQQHRAEASVVRPDIDDFCIEEVDDVPAALLQLFPDEQPSTEPAERRPDTADGH
jgi:hypothetical protein